MSKTAVSGVRGERLRLFDLEHTRAMVRGVFGQELHGARVDSIANGVAGALNATMASVAAIGRAYAELSGISTKSGVKQVDRLLSNDGVALDKVLCAWVRYVIGSLPSVVLAIDWTDFEADDHTTLCLSLITTHGRATPLVWHTVKKSELAGRRTQYELSLVKKLHSWLPTSTRVELLGDRAFGYVELYRLLSELGWDYTLRFRENVVVFEEGDEIGLAASAYVPENGRTRTLFRPRVTTKRFEVPAVVLVKRKGMKQAWCLATSRVDRSAESVKAYSRRFTIEETFRDTKDITFGAGLSATHIRSGVRRDRLLLLIVIAHTALTVLGAASEASGLDRTLKTNTAKHRTMSLLNQGLCWYRALTRGTVRMEWRQMLLSAYEDLLREHSFLGDILLFDVASGQK